MAKTPSKNNISDDPELYIKVLEQYFASKYINKQKLYIANFWRGVAFGFGSIIAATIGIALLIWILSWFNSVPLIGNFIHTLQNSLNNYTG